MTQESGPLAGQNFTDTTWRALFGGEPAIVGDAIGDAYTLTQPPSTDDVTLGSALRDSTSVVGGFVHRIPAGSAQALTIPASSNASFGRTDLIVVRYDPSYTTVPGPCRLYRIPGVEGSSARPAYNASPPGLEDMPLYAITRKQGEALNQASVVDLRVRTGPSLVVPAGASVPASVPLGTRLYRDGTVYQRALVDLAPAWVTISKLGTVAPVTTTAHFTSNLGVTVKAGRARLYGSPTKVDSVSTVGADVTVATGIPAAARPSRDEDGLAWMLVGSGEDQRSRVFPITAHPDGTVTLRVTVDSGTLATGGVLRINMGWDVE